MSLIRRNDRQWDPFREFDDMSRAFNRVFGRSAMAPAPASREVMTAFDWTPTINVSETPQAYILKADLPGVKKEDVKVRLEDGVLAVSGERKYEQDHKEERVHRVEAAYGSFFRSFSVPDDAAHEGIEATFKDGVLNVRIPKVAEKKPAARQIEVG